MPIAAFTEPEIMAGFLAGDIRNTNTVEALLLEIGVPKDEIESRVETALSQTSFDLGLGGETGEPVRLRPPVSQPPTRLPPPPTSLPGTIDVLSMGGQTTPAIIGQPPISTEQESYEQWAKRHMEAEARRTAGTSAPLLSASGGVRNGTGQGGETGEPAPVPIIGTGQGGETGQPKPVTVTGDVRADDTKTGTELTVLFQPDFNYGVQAIIDFVKDGQLLSSEAHSYLVNKYLKDNTTEEGVPLFSREDLIAFQDSLETLFKEGGIEVITLDRQVRPRAEGTGVKILRSAIGVEDGDEDVEITAPPINIGTNREIFRRYISSRPEFRTPVKRAVANSQFDILNTQFSILPELSFDTSGEHPFRRFVRNADYEMLQGPRLRERLSKIAGLIDEEISTENVGALAGPVSGALYENFGAGENARDLQLRAAALPVLMRLDPSQHTSYLNVLQHAQDQLLDQNPNANFLAWALDSPITQVP